MLANQVFQPGQHDLTWDGLDGAGNAVAKGVYFYRLRSAGFTSAARTVLLK
jgi:hypothetical protein